MIKYDVFWKTLKQKNIKKQTLVDKYEFSKGLIDNLMHNRSITINTLNDICTKLNITPDQVITYTNEKE